jgi:hypothetical protein
VHSEIQGLPCCDYAPVASPVNSGMGMNGPTTQKGPLPLVLYVLRIENLRSARTSGHELAFFRAIGLVAGAAVLGQVVEDRLERVGILRQASA